ncbi:MAG: ThuA domain-containing protein [Pseudomonadales bacterium]
MIKKLFKYLFFLFLLVVAVLSWRAYKELEKSEVFKEPAYESQAPELPADFGEGGILVFSKTNSYRHFTAIDAVQELFVEYGLERGVPVYITENGAVHSPELLARFDLVVWNNNTGDVLSLPQRAALRAYIEGGGSWMGIHGAGGNRSYEWDWFADELLRARFIGHPMFPQFQMGNIINEAQEDAITAHISPVWAWEEEWYSFAESPRPRTKVLLSLDDESYAPVLDLKMNGDHPLVWRHKLGQGSVFFSALGHKGSYYKDPTHRTMLKQAADWLLAEKHALESEAP